MANKIRSWAIVVVVGCILGGCAYPYNKDRPYDPNFTSEQLIDQIPNWEGEARKVCAGHLPPEQRKPHQTGRC